MPPPKGKNCSKGKISKQGRKPLKRGWTVSLKMKSRTYWWLDSVSGHNPVEVKEEANNGGNCSAVAWPRPVNLRPKIPKIWDLRLPEQPLASTREKDSLRTQRRQSWEEIDGACRLSGEAAAALPRPHEQLRCWDSYACFALAKQAVSRTE